MSGPVLIAGATGGVGRHLVRRLLARNYPVRALVRDVEKARQVLGPQVELVGGDTRKPHTLAPAVAGVRAVICVTGSRSPLGPNSPKHVDYEGVRNLVTAARAAGVEHFVLISSIGVTRPNLPPDAFGREFRNILHYWFVRRMLVWKFKGEEAVRESGLTYTIVRPGGLTDEPGGRKALRFDQGDRITGRISRADLAEVCIQALQQPGARNVTFEVVEGEGPPPGDWTALFADLKPDK